jgi:FKBP-type peptidyl-prolyl cis-trans isomerase FklB
MDKFSYAIGLGIGQNLLSMGARSIDVNDFAQAIKDVLEGNQTAISHNEAREIVNKYFTELERRKHRKGKGFPGRKQEKPEHRNLAKRIAVRSNH